MHSYAVLAWFEGAKGSIRVNGQGLSLAKHRHVGCGFMASYMSTADETREQQVDGEFA
jgi:hypothetical protein